MKNEKRHYVLWGTNYITANQPVIKTFHLVCKTHVSAYEIVGSVQKSANVEKLIERQCRLARGFIQSAAQIPLYWLAVCAGRCCSTCRLVAVISWMREPWCLGRRYAHAAASVLIFESSTAAAAAAPRRYMPCRSEPEIRDPSAFVPRREAAVTSIYPLFDLFIIGDARLAFKGSIIRKLLCQYRGGCTRNLFSPCFSFICVRITRLF